MIKNMKVKTFIILSFLWILIILVILGSMSIFFMQRLANQTIDFYDGPHSIQVQLAEIQTDMANIGSAIKEAIAYKTDEKTQETTELLSGYLEQMNTRITYVKEHFDGDTSLITAADEAVAAWLAANDKIRGHMEKDQYDEALKVFQTEYLPAEDNMITSVSKISDYADSVTKSYYDTAKRSKVISLVVIIFMVVVAVALAVSVCIVMIKSIMIPLRKVQSVADAMSRGELNVAIDYESKNEFGELVQSIRRTTETVSAYVADIDGILNQMANQNMNIEIQQDYIGDFSPIKTSLERITLTLNSTISQIRDCSEQVAGGAEQVSSSSSILSQGASEQATTVEEISNNLEAVTENIQKNAAYTEETKALADHVGSQLEQGNAQMKELLDAISNINSASDQIAKIIKTIEDIAFQTNILALNAAVEAARAGVAGKGFAVVADEVRNLAGKSAEAAKSTTELIQNSIKAVQEGTEIAGSTAQTLESVVTGTVSIIGKVSQIAESSEEQAGAMAQVNSSMSQISQVVQTNSATAEETAAISEELSGQSQTLENLVFAFQLKDLR